MGNPYKKLDAAILTYLQNGSKDNDALMCIRSLLPEHPKNQITSLAYIKLVKKNSRDKSINLKQPLFKGRQRYLRAYGYLIFHTLPYNTGNATHKEQLQKALVVLSEYAQGAKDDGCCDAYHILGAIEELKGDSNKAQEIFYEGMEKGCGLCQKTLSDPYYTKATQDRIAILCKNNGNNYASNYFELGKICFESGEYSDGLTFFSTTVAKDPTNYYADNIINHILNHYENLDSEQLKRASKLVTTLNEPEIGSSLETYSDEIKKLENHPRKPVNRTNSFWEYLTLKKNNENAPENQPTEIELQLIAMPY